MKCPHKIVQARRHSLQGLGITRRWHSWFRLMLEYGFTTELECTVLKLVNIWWVTVLLMCTWHNLLHQSMASINCIANLLYDRVSGVGNVLFISEYNWKFMSKLGCAGLLSKPNLNKKYYQLRLKMLKSSVHFGQNPHRPCVNQFLCIIQPWEVKVTQ